MLCLTYTEGIPKPQKNEEYYWGWKHDYLKTNLPSLLSFCENKISYLLLWQYGTHLEHTILKKIERGREGRGRGREGGGKGKNIIAPSKSKIHHKTKIKQNKHTHPKPHYLNFRGLVRVWKYLNPLSLTSLLQYSLAHASCVLTCHISAVPCLGRDLMPRVH